MLNTAPAPMPAPPPTATVSVAIDWAGERWNLLADRALHWPRRRTLIVADLHLGKAASFRAAGVPVPEVVAADLDRLSALLDLTGVDRLIIVGDLIHARSGRTRAVIEAVASWRAQPRRARLDIVLVRGNHDARAGDPPDSWLFRSVNGPWLADPGDPVAFLHDPDSPAAAGSFCIGGHLHPAVVMHDSCSSLRASCFWVRGCGGTEFGSMVLPAFGRFTGGRAVRPRRGDRLFAIGDGEVAEARLREPARA